MASDPSPDQIASADDFLTTFRGSFTSALRWHHLDALWERLRERADKEDNGGCLDIFDMGSLLREAAQALGVDPRTITVGIEDGTIPSVKLGRRVVIPREKFLRLFADPATEGGDS